MPQLVSSKIDYTVMGSEECPIDKDSSSLYFVSLRIGKIEGLEGCSKCEVRLWGKLISHIGHYFPQQPHQRY
jgi:hypothetical protein